MINVAGYCRVSTDKEDQVNSFEAQQQYFREYISNQPDWMFYKIYADEGITGTSTKKRIQFNQMINDAYDGRFQMIVTKEVSRFSRNILDTIRYTRELKALGIGVLFLTDNISTMDPASEMLLSFLASIAQEESRKTSIRVIWGQTRQMEKGVVFGRSMLGYDVKNGQINLNPAGAELVRLIFYKYAVEQVSTSVIARFLTEEGYHSSRSSCNWKASAVIKILKNEKYVGDLVQKKTYTPDFLTHEKQKNSGQVPLIIIRNHHEPIISREIWNLTQERLEKNNKHSKKAGGHSNRYIFSGRIKCKECGSSFTAGYRKQKDGSKIRRWYCGTSGCSVGRVIRDDDAMRMLSTAIQSLSVDFGTVIREVTELALNALNSFQSTTENDIQALKTIIEAKIVAVLSGEIKSETFFKTILDQITVFKDRHIELRLNNLSHVFHFSA